MKIQNVLREAPIQDLDHVGDFSKGSSFTDKRDRAIITHPASIQNIKRKFGKVSTNINLLFVNTKEGRNFTEVGKVDESWVKKNLGDQVYNSLQKMNKDNALTVIFTNNKGDQKVPMTPWIMAHRIMHSLARPSMSWTDRTARQYPGYGDVADEIVRFIGAYVVPAYIGYDRRYPESYEALSRSNRKFQLLFKYLFHAIGTFRSARENKLRDWFEVINEIGAQYIITGDVKFNKLPKTIGPKGFGREYHLTNDDLMVDQAEEAIESMGSYVKMKMDRLLKEAVGTIVVM
jgi:hypothetical protein